MGSLEKVTFSQPLDAIGWIDMEVRWQSPREPDSRNAPVLQASVARISNVYCAFRELVAWMDSVARRVDPAAVKWDDEGREVELVYESGRLWFSNRGHDGWWQADIPAPGLAEAFYSAFREFIRTDYDRTRYETLHCLREVFLNQLRGRQTLTDLLLPIAALPRHEAARTFAAYAQGHHDIVFSREPDGVPKFATRRVDMVSDSKSMRDWETVGRNRRLRFLRRLLNSRIFFEGSNTSLKRLRSRAIDRHMFPKVDRRRGGL